MVILKAIMISFMLMLIVFLLKQIINSKNDEKILKLYQEFNSIFPSDESTKQIVNKLDPHSIAQTWSKLATKGQGIYLGYANYIITLEDDSDFDVFGFQLVFKIKRKQYIYSFFPEKFYKNKLEIKEV